MKAALRRLLVSATVTGGLLLALGFIVFVYRLDWVGSARTREADGAVVLTGGAERIAEAVSLVAKGYAARLLITGVNEATRGAEIARLTPEFDEYFKCCIDLDHAALNTEGNAAAARRWARQRSMHSLIVVTSNYHMPRALLEMRAALPDVSLQAYAVLPDGARGTAWFTQPQLIKVLVLEYLKYLRATLRLQFSPAAPGNDDSIQTALATTAAR